MRVVNTNFETIAEYDLSKGELVEVTTLREDMIPVDNVTKFAPDDADWEQALMYVPCLETDTSYLVASRNIIAGEYVTISGVLYKAIENIPNGEPIIVGQNAVETTIEAQLRELKGE